MSFLTLCVLFVSHMTHSYEILNVKKAWDDAEQYCIDECNSHLASVHSEEEYNEIADILHINSIDYGWIGLYKPNGNNPFEWVDGTLFDYGTQFNVAPWRNDQPDGDGNCVEQYSPDRDGDWFDLTCSYPEPFICNSCSTPTTALPTIFTSSPTWNPVTKLPTTTPTTSSPTTALPTTALPTTSLPTTSLPTTSLPTTSLPTTLLPTTAMPSTYIPTTETPTTTMTNAASSDIPTDHPISITVTNQTETTLTSITTENVYSSTNAPTNRPTSVDVSILATIAPTMSPTKMSPTKRPIDIENNTGENNSGWIVLYVIGGSVLICILVFCVLIIFTVKKQKISANQEEMKIAMSSINAVTTDNINNNTLRVDTKTQDGDLLTKGYSKHITNNNIICITPTETLKGSNDLKEWLMVTVDLPQYLDNFIMHGYDSIAFVKEIQNESQLLEIGIDKTYHQRRILMEIERLNDVEYNQNKVTEEGCKGGGTYSTPTHNIHGVTDGGTLGNHENNTNIGYDEFIIQ